MSNPAYLDVRSLAERLGGSKPIPRSTLYRWVKDGYLPAPVKLGPGTVRWVEAEIAAFEKRCAEDRNAERNP
jgi:predicted DNA-binding transcriptional regulator AlpA